MWNETATAANDWNGCHLDQGLPCYRSQRLCDLDVSLFVPNNPSKPTRIHLNASGIPDHNAWGLVENSYIGHQDNANIRIPKSPIMLPIAEAMQQGAGLGAVGVALNGVAIFNPYNDDCCDVTFKELKTMDYCLAHPAQGRYHYHMFSRSSQYDKCLMSCAESEVSDIVGVANDGFPIYGPMQYYSESEGKVYIDPDQCSNCTLMQLNSRQTDACGGIEVADYALFGVDEYRYIASNTFPYFLQCYRGDMSMTQKWRMGAQDWTTYTFNNKCGIDSTGDDGKGSTWFDSPGMY